jgi:hypothetical protein
VKAADVLRADRVGRLDDGQRAIPVRKHDTPESVRAIFAAYDEDLVMAEGRTLVDWCPHTEDYKYRHGCDEWCDRPSPRLVWTAAYPKEAPRG